MFPRRDRNKAQSASDNPSLSQDIEFLAHSMVILNDHEQERGEFVQSHPENYPPVTLSLLLWLANTKEKW